MNREASELQCLSVIALVAAMSLAGCKQFWDDARDSRNAANKGTELVKTFWTPTPETATAWGLTHISSMRVYLLEWSKIEGSEGRYIFRFAIDCDGVTKDGGNVRVSQELHGRLRIVPKSGKAEFLGYELKNRKVITAAGMYLAWLALSMGEPTVLLFFVIAVCGNPRLWKWARMLSEFVALLSPIYSLLETVGELVFRRPVLAAVIGCVLGLPVAGWLAHDIFWTWTAVLLGLVMYAVLTALLLIVLNRPLCNVRKRQASVRG